MRGSELSSDSSPRLATADLDFSSEGEVTGLFSFLPLRTRDEVRPTDLREPEEELLAAAGVGAPGVFGVTRP